MKKLFWVLAIIGLGVVGHFDQPELHHPADISRTEKADLMASYTTIDQYQAVSLNAKRGRK